MLLCGTFFPPQVSCSIPCCFTYTANIVLPEWVHNILWTDTLLFLYTCSQSLITTLHKTTCHPQHIQIHHQKWIKANQISTSSRTIQWPALRARSSGPSRQANSPPFPPSTGKSAPNRSVTSYKKQPESVCCCCNYTIMYSFYDINIRQMCIILHLFMCFL